LLLVAPVRLSVGIPRYFEPVGGEFGKKVSFHFIYFLNPNNLDTDVDDLPRGDVSAGRKNLVVVRVVAHDMKSEVQVFAAVGELDVAVGQAVGLP
jgi:hypothetical protein